MGRYESMRARAAKQLKKYGQLFTFEWMDSETFNAQTGDVSGGTKKVLKVYGIEAQTKRGRKGADDVSQRTVQLILAALDEKGVVITRRLEDGDRALVGGTVKYVVKESAPVAPGGIAVIFQVQATLP